jgi:thymidylate synthase
MLMVLKGKRPRDIINPQEGFLMTKGSEKKRLRKSLYKDHSEASRKAMVTRYKNMKRELDQYKEGEVVPGTIVDKYRKPFSFEKIIQKLPESNKKVRIKQLYDDIRETNPKGTLHADHFKEVQLGGVDNPLNIVATTETAHRGRLFEKGNFMNKSTLVKKINKNNKQIFNEWNSNPASRKAIKNRTHPLVKKKDELYNSQIDIEGGTGHLFDASLPGTHIKKGDAVVFKPNKIDPELKKILEVNNSYYGAGKNKFGKFDNAEDHLIDQLEKLKFSLDEMISTNFQGDVAAYKRYISKLQKTETGRAIKGAMPMAGGGMININQLIRPL